MAVQVGIDAKKSAQVVRGAVVMPNGTGKTKRVAVFAQGAKDDSRIDIRYTGGAPNGMVEIPVPESVRPGGYEVRLFSSGGWTRPATSAVFTIVAPQASQRPAT